MKKTKSSPEKIIKSTFWLPQPVDNLCPEIARDENCDVFIIGGGISGLSTALHVKMRSPENDVVLVEADRIGYGSGGLNSGQCAPRVGPDIGIQILKSGKKNALLNYQYSLDACNYLKDFLHLFNLEFEETEQWQISLSSAGYKKNLTTISEYASLGVRLGYYDKLTLIRMMPDSQRIQNAISFPASFINPGLFCVNLKKLALDSGVRIFESSPAELNVTLLQGHARVNGFNIKSKKVILAIDRNISFTPRSFSAVHPIRTYISVTRPLSDNELSAIGWKNRAGLYDNRKYFKFLRPLSHNRLLIGGEYRFNNKRSECVKTHKVAVNSLMTYLAALFPSLNKVESEYSWSGVSGCTLTGWPVVKPMDDSERCWQIGSWNGHGVALGFYAGKNLAEKILDESSHPAVPWNESPGIPVPYWLSAISIPTYLACLKYYGNFSFK